MGGEGLKEEWGPGSARIGRDGLLLISISRLTYAHMYTYIVYLSQFVISAEGKRR